MQIAGAVLLFGAARIVGRQVQGGNLLTQVVGPILGGTQLCGRAGVFLALPAGVVGVLNGRSRQRRGIALAGAPVSLGEVVHQDRIGPGVRDDMVHVQQQDVVIVLERDQRCANQRGQAQVKRRAGLGRNTLGDGSGPGVGRETRQVVFVQMDSGLRVKYLPGLVVQGLECSSQHIVSVDNLLQGRVQRCGIQGAAQAQCVGQVVGAAAGRQLLQEPQALLGERQGRGAAMGLSLDGML
ncbi:hypothetical protein PFLU3_53960 [Pseudomonas fluorescens]|uniref:Uncharacterized protein n=1 Tax=Pseudomonas fluorescens TaxID=294 RepID=A0A0D0SVT9_PSEFL|nr:hypothetical protein PFLU3_53960 [Pseudomonas fluorescens]